MGRCGHPRVAARPAGASPRGPPLSQWASARNGTLSRANDQPGAAPKIPSDERDRDFRGDPVEGAGEPLMNGPGTALSTPHDAAIVDAEARRLAHTLASYGGVLTDRQLVKLSGARHWSSGAFSLALGRALETGLIRDLGLGFFASPVHLPPATRRRGILTRPFSRAPVASVPDDARADDRAVTNTSPTETTR